MTTPRQSRSLRRAHDPVTAIILPRHPGDPNPASYPLRYLAPNERADYLARATRPLDPPTPSPGETEER